MTDSSPDLAALETSAVDELTGPSRAAWENIQGHLDTENAIEVYALAKNPRFVEHARRLLSVAYERARALQRGEIAYSPDKLFTLDECHAAERALAIALAADAEWATESLDILRLVAVAPTEAKTVPSQGMVFALARAIRSFPTPESIPVLANARLEVRHAGVRKKLDRDLATAKRNLPARPKVALRITSQDRLKKTEINAWLRALEGCWLHGASWPVAEWLRVMHARPELSKQAASLVWIFEREASFTGFPDQFTDAHGEVVTLRKDAVIRLWHPILASPEEQTGWRGYVTSRHLTQPFKQAFREFYRPEDLHLDGLVLDAKQLIGLGGKEGWNTAYCTMERRVGPVMAEFTTTGNLYPGCEGHTTIGDVVIGLAQRSGEERVTWQVDASRVDELDPVATSEVLRSADLLASTSAVALDDNLTWWHTSAQTPGGVLNSRRLALEMVLADLEPSADLEVEERHVRVKDARVHLATAQVTRAGELVEVEPTPDHHLWSPPDPLLNRIVDLVVALRQEG